MKYNENIDHLLKKIKTNDHFSFIKFNHGWWDKLVLYGVNDIVPKLSEKNDFLMSAKIYCKAIQKGGWRISEDVVFDCLYGLKHSKSYGKKLHIGVWHTGYRRNYTDADFSKKKRNEKILYPKYIDNINNLYSGIIWKNMVFDNKLAEFIDVIKNKNLTIVAPEGESPFRESGSVFENFGKIFNIKNYSFIPIDSRSASFDYLKIKNSIKNNINNKDNLILLKAGPVGSALIFSLHNDLENTTMIDLGNMMDIFEPLFFKRTWLKRKKEKMIKMYSKDLSKIWDLN